MMRNATKSLIQEIPEVEERARATSASAEQNIRTIARLEQETMEQRAWSERVGDMFTRVMGSLGFVIAHVIGFGLWFTINLGAIPGVEPFDPFPFGILTLIVSAEGVFLAIFVLISQNRMTRQSDKRAHLDLQVNMLSEQEMTLMLRMQQRLCEHFGVEVGAVRDEAKQLL